VKVRNGFVSNSSSSSFICDVCGSVKSGWNLSLQDADMIECANGHTVCTSHLLKEAEIGEDDDATEVAYSYPIDCCPICQMKVVTDDEMLKYLLLQNYNTFKEAKEKYTELINTQFSSNYKEFSAFLKKGDIKESK